MHQRRGFRWIEGVAVGRHVSAALQHLASDLIFRHSGRNGVQRRAAQAAEAAQRVAVATLLLLKDQRSLAFERRSAVKIFQRAPDRWSTRP